MIVGFAFMYHGYAKLVRGPEHFVEIPHALGVPMPGLMGWITIGQTGATKFLYLACLTTMVLGGTGPLSLDMFFAKRGLPKLSNFVGFIFRPTFSASPL